MVLSKFLPDRFKNILYVWASLGVFLFLAGFFIAPKLSAVKVVFYLGILLPFLILLLDIYQEREKYVQPIIISSFLLCTYLATSGFWGDGSTLDVFVYLYKQVLYITAWLIMCIWLASVNPKLFLLIPRFIISLGCIVILVTIAVYVYKTNLTFPRLEGLGVLKNPLTAAQAYGTVGIMAYAIGKETYNKTIFNPYFGVMVIAALGVVLTQSRGPILYMSIVLVCAIVVYKVPLNQVLRKIALVIFLGVALYAIYPEIFAPLKERGLSWSYRDEIWKLSIEKSLNSPVFGQGMARVTSFGVSDGLHLQHSHNAWVDIFHFGGFVGVMLAIWHIKTCFTGWHHKKEYLPVYLWLLFGCFSSFTNGKSFLTRPDWMWLYYWIPIGIICGYRAIAMKEKKEQQ